MTERYPDYDVLAKRDSPSWNDITRRVIDRRLATPGQPRFLTAAEFLTLSALADEITPQPADRDAIPVAALIDEKLFASREDGYRGAGMPRQREAWRRGLAALNAEAVALFAVPFHQLNGAARQLLIARLAAGELRDAAWGSMPSQRFFTARVIDDIVQAYWSHPTSWNEIGWGGRASPRGYVRMGFDERDPWEAKQRKSDAPRPRNAA